MEKKITVTIAASIGAAVTVVVVVLLALQQQQTQMQIQLQNQQQQFQSQLAEQDRKNSDQDLKNSLAVEQAEFGNPTCDQLQQILDGLMARNDGTLNEAEMLKLEHAQDLHIVQCEVQQ